MTNKKALALCLSLSFVGQTHYYFSNHGLTFLHLDFVGELLIQYQHPAFEEAHNSALAKAGQRNKSSAYESASGSSLGRTLPM